MYINPDPSLRKEIDWSSLSQSLVSGTDGPSAIPLLYLMPMVKDRYRSYDGKFDLHEAHCVLLRRENEHGTAVYTRVGVAMLFSTSDNFFELFSQHQLNLGKDDYIDMDSAGTCTITVI